jgi:hypothetical protein
MTRSIRMLLVATAAVVLVAQAAGAQLRGSFDGMIVGKKLPQTYAASAVFIQNGKFANGTMALPADLPTFGGSYLVQGKATAKKLAVKGGGGLGGGFLKYTAKLSGSTLKGKVTIKAPHAKPFHGTLTYTENVVTTDGSSCDGVYNANQQFFTEMVLHTAMSICSTCHASGLQADGTRLSVEPIDPLATARSMVEFIDSANPSQSLILLKPQNLVPHGGNVQILPNSTELQILTQWVQMVAAAHCN